MGIILTGVLMIGAVTTISIVAAANDKEVQKEVIKAQNDSIRKLLDAEKYEIEKLNQTTFKVESSDTPIHFEVTEKKNYFKVSVLKEKREWFCLEKDNGETKKNTKILDEQMEAELIEYIENQQWKNKIDIKDLKKQEYKLTIPYLDTCDKKLKEDLSYLEELLNKIELSKLSIRGKHELQTKNNSLSEIIKRINKIDEKEQKEQLENQLSEIVSGQIKELKKIIENEKKDNIEKIKEEMEFLKKM